MKIFVQKIEDWKAKFSSFRTMEKLSNIISMMIEKTFSLIEILLSNMKTDILKIKSLIENEMYLRNEEKIFKLKYRKEKDFLADSLLRFWDEILLWLLKRLLMNHKNLLHAKKINRWLTIKLRIKKTKILPTLFLVPQNHNQELTSLAYQSHLYQMQVPNDIWQWQWDKDNQMVM